MRRRPDISQFVTVSHQACESSDVPAAVDFNGLTVTAQRQLCQTGMQYQAATVQSNPTSSLAFSKSVDQMQYQV